MPLRASTAVVRGMAALSARVSCDSADALLLLREKDACGGRLVMSHADVGLGEAQILPCHGERRVSHFFG